MGFQTKLCPKNCSLNLGREEEWVMFSKNSGGLVVKDNWVIFVSGLLRCPGGREMSVL